MTDQPISQRLDQFFNSRSIHKIYGHNQFGWRGQGYDEGWEDATRQDMAELNALLTEWLAQQGQHNDTPPRPCSACGGVWQHLATCPLRPNGTG